MTDLVVTIHQAELLGRWKLTPRETEVLVFVSKGFTNVQVAGLLNLSRYTVTQHLQSVFHKLDVDSRTEAAVWASKAGIV